MKKILSVWFLVQFLATSAYGNVNCFLRRLKSVKTLKLVFSQETKIPVAGDEVDLYGGVIYYEKPSKFRWEYTRGSDVFVVSDGKFIETVFPSDKQCQVAELDSKSELFPLFQILDSPDKFGELFEVLNDERDGKIEVLELKPRYKDSIFEKIVLFIGENCKLKAFKTVQLDGTSSTYIVKELRENLKVSEDLFKLIPCFQNSLKQ